MCTQERDICFPTNRTSHTDHTGTVLGILCPNPEYPVLTLEKFKMVTSQVMTAVGIVTCYIMGRSLAWNWLSLGALIFLVPFTFGLYYIPESPPWLVYNDEEDLAFKSMSQIRGEEYDATCEIEHFKVNSTLPP